VQLLREWRAACLERPPPLPRPWLEEEAWVPGLVAAEEAGGRGAFDNSAKVAALAASIVDVLAAPVDLRRALHASALAFPFPLAHERRDEAAEPEAEAPRGFPALAPVPPAGGDVERPPEPCAAALLAAVGAGTGSAAPHDVALLEAFLSAPPPAPDVRFAAMGGRMAAKFLESGAKVRARAAAERAAKSDAALAAYAARRLQPFRFSDEVDGLTSMIWFSASVARGEPAWVCTPLPKPAELTATGLRLREGALECIRRRLFGGKEDGRRQLKVADTQYFVAMDEGAGARAAEQ
jgi:hypothetical protein